MKVEWVESARSEKTVPLIDAILKLLPLGSSGLSVSPLKRLRFVDVEPSCRITELSIAIGCVLSAFAIEIAILATLD